MSNMNPIPATKVAAGSGAPAPQALQAGAGNVFANTAGQSFFDIIIARLAAAENAGTPATTATENAAVATTPVTASADAGANTQGTALPGQSDNPLVQLQVALASQNVNADGDIVVNDAKADTLKTQLDFTNQIINHLKNMLPENSEKDGMFAKVLAKLQAKSDNLQASISALEHNVITKDTAVEDIPMPLLISLGLSPSQISQVTDKIQNLEKKLGRDITVEDIIAGVGGIVPPASADTSIAASAAMAPPAPSPAQDTGKPKKSDVSDITGGIDENTKPTDDLAAKLNAMDVGGGADAAAAQNKNEIVTGPNKKMKGLPDAIDKAAAAPKDAAPVPAPTPAADTQVKKPLMNFKENLVNMMNNLQNGGDLSFSPSFGGDGSSDFSGLQQYGLTPSTSLSLGTTAQAANTITTTALAGDAHPATNMVAAQIVKFASVNGDQTMQIRMDPPELGNVAVRLQIAKDKGVKAHLVIEKPETYMMLQRDGQSLERALQHAGLDAGAGSVTFELANQNGNAFSNGNDQGGGNNFGGGNAGPQNAGAAEDIVQSSVNWQVDPSTGHVRYNIFA